MTQKRVSNPNMSDLTAGFIQKIHTSTGGSIDSLPAEPAIQVQNIKAIPNENPENELKTRYRYTGA